MKTMTRRRSARTFFAVILSVAMVFAMMPMMPFAARDAHAAEGDVEINTTTFPDANFRTWVKTNVTGGSDTLTAAKIAGVTSIDVSSNSISSLKGIEYFTSLTSLNCGNNQLTALDVSSNGSLQTLRCGINQIAALDVNNNTKLTDLYCNANQLTSLDVSNNTKLTHLNCDGNQLTSLDVSNNTALTSLSCRSNQLSALDVNNNTKLTDLYCNENQLTSLDVSNNTALTSLSCSSNQLSALDVNNNTKLTDLYCNENQLTNLDVSKNTKLETLECYKNQLASLDVSNNKSLQTLFCQSNKLTALDVSNNTALKYFDCTDNNLATLDVSNNTALMSLFCDGNQLTSLDLSSQTILAWSHFNPDQKPVIQASLVNGKYVVDLQANDTKIDLGKITDLKVNGQDYTLNNGEIAFDTLPAAGDQVITYTYATGCKTGSNKDAKTMTVSASVSYTPPAPATYAVTLSGNDGTGTDLTTYTEGTGATLPTDWTKDGYTFAGWYDNEGLTGDAVTAITGSDSGAKTFYAKWTLDKPAAMKAVKAKAAGKHSVKLTWSKAKGADQYKVYRAASKSGSAKSAAAAGKYKYIGKTAGTSFTAKGLKAGTKYYFKVKAVNDAGTAKSAAVTAKTAKEPVSFKLANVRGSNVKVKWSKVSGASKYQVASNTSGKMKTKWTGRNSTCAYTSTGLTKGKTYKFKMRYRKTVSGKNVWSKWTSVKTIKVK